MGANKPSQVQVGLQFETNTSGTLEVISVHRKYAEIKFIKTGYTKTVAKCEVLNGKVKDPYFPLVHGRGFVGEGVFIPKEHKENYARWYAIFRRCYDEANNRFPNYEHHFVNEDWFNFQSYMEWAVNQPNYNKKGWQLDKDLLVLDNLEYGPNSCCFIPKEVNMAIITNRIQENVLGTGVIFDKKLGKFLARAQQTHKKSKHIGCYNTSEEAFEAYKTCKILYVRHLAEKYREELDPLVYEAMLNWKVREVLQNDY